MIDAVQFAKSSPWVIRFYPLIPDGGKVLDLACGDGRHAIPLANTGYNVTAVDKDLSALPTHERIEQVEANFEDGSLWPLSQRTFDGIVVTNYLHRPLFPILIDSLVPDGVLIYETFAAGNEAFGRPKNPRFLLKPRELIDAFSSRMFIVAYENGRVTTPRPAMVQRFTGIKQSQFDQIPLISQATTE